MKDDSNAKGRTRREQVKILRSVFNRRGPWGRGSLHSTSAMKYLIEFLHGWVNGPLSPSKRVFGVVVVMILVFCSWWVLSLRF
jgi:hypothetical protein